MQLTNSVQIVQEGSALLGLPNEEPIPINANHRDLCRFGDRRSQDYLVVCRKLLEICKASTTTEISIGTDPFK